MYRSANTLLGYAVKATDGDIGSIIQFYFDDQTWTARYFVVRTGKWLLGRQVLISPIALRYIDDGKKFMQINLKKSSVGNSPAVNINKPVSRRYERDYYNYYGWPFYWDENGRWGAEMYPTPLFTAAPTGQASRPPQETGRPTNLRSTAEMNGFKVMSRDGSAGTIEDFLLNDETWEVRYVVVGASDIAPGMRILASPHWIDTVSIAEKMIVIDAPLAVIKSAPLYRPSEAITGDYELALFKHYGVEKEIDAAFVRTKVPA